MDIRTDPPVRRHIGDSWRRLRHAVNAACTACALSALVVGAGTVHVSLAARAQPARASLQARFPSGRVPGSCAQDSRYYGVAALSSANVWMVGEDCRSDPLIEHWDGWAWHFVPSPRTVYPGGLSAVAAVSVHDVWAVGDFGSVETSQTLIEHWDGRRWRMVPSPTSSRAAASVGYELKAVAARAPDDVWAVGDTLSGNPLAEHWNGHRWRVVPVPTDAGILMGVATVSAHDVWAVDNAADILHWDGQRWRIVPSPSGEPLFAPGAPVALNAVAAVSAHDVWAVGGYDAGACCREGSGPLAEHWDGRRWRVVHSPNIPDSVVDSLAGITFYGVTAISTRDVWAVGSGLEHWDGHGWHIMPDPISVGGDFGPVSVSAVSTRDVWAVGNQSDTQILIEHWDGHRWRIVPPPNPVR